MVAVLQYCGSCSLCKRLEYNTCNASFIGGDKQGIRFGGMLRDCGVCGIKKEGEWPKKYATDFAKNDRKFFCFVFSF